MIDANEAAERLGVSRRRVYALISFGQLEAERVGNAWVLDEGSVDAHAKTVNKKGGRPAKGSGPNDLCFLLMNRSHIVAELVYNGAGDVFTGVKGMFERSRMPLGIASTRKALDLTALNAWWRERGLRADRPDLRQLLEAAGADIPEQLLVRNLGLSLSDQYWIAPVEEDIRWEDVNFFHNGYEALAEEPGSSSLRRHPDNTSDGMLPKHWGIKDGVRVLYKGGTEFGQEPCNEVIATELYRRLLSAGEFVPYELTRSRGALESKCAQFLRDDEEYIPAVYVAKIRPREEHVSQYHHFVACCKELGITDAERSLWHMMVGDDILANTDRHWRNFGVVRNVETLECRLAPIFDSGTSLWCKHPELLTARDFTYESKQFDPHPGRQLQYADVSWFKAEALDGFVDFARGVLAESMLPAERIDLVCEGLAWRIERMRHIAEYA